MFNFFDEIKKNISGIEPQLLSSYHIVNISGKILYVEGHLGLSMLSKEMVIFKVKRARIGVTGSNMILAELTENTLKILGDIEKVEVLS